MKKEKFGNRSKYRYELERFVNRIVDFVNKGEFSKEEFLQFVDTIFKPLESIEKPYIHSEYLKALEKFVEKNANLHLTKMSIEEIKGDITKEANLLRKLKRKKSYNKQKHKSSPQGEYY